MKINVISTIPFQKKIRVDKNDINTDKAAAIAALSGAHAATTALEISGWGSAGMAGTYLAYSTSTPSVALSSPQCPLTMSTGCFSSSIATDVVNDRITEKVIPSLEKELGLDDDNK